MRTQKPLASLSSTLLARKGTARPAMRPQGFGGFGAPQSVHDDLGWNDMGEAEPAPEPVVAAVPPVLLQREALQEELAAPAVEKPVAAKAPVVAKAQIAIEPPAPVEEQPVRKSVSVATATRIGRETRAHHKGAAKSAFTLRLDAERHLLLRLASALEKRSAQMLVTEALDAFLTTLPDVAELASQVPNRAGK
ncbi:hypothetical protein ASG11_17625 [Sphingomonas sp. Leaf357]|uniref:hypothetical protein n=1 Tax=Sphingomonas sp. Leaf357 TaxID=1736350 RepID=UPI0006FEF946|nr:hypothetical protein [Sphingomonas sp. Leaf357]KQS01599.1 hypothetical protein ASG11_17625 [Sphingomonas sp. Leaf357]